MTSAVKENGTLNSSETDETKKQEWDPKKVADWDVPSEDDPDCFDPESDESRPVIVKFEDVTAASFKIKMVGPPTPCIRSHLSEATGMELFLKKEFQNSSGSFKWRGVRAALSDLTPEQRARGVLTASLGNHALAVGLHAKQLGIPCAIFMPMIAGIQRLALCKRIGVPLYVVGNTVFQTKLIARKYSKLTGMKYINGDDSPKVIAGQGTLGLEIVEQMKGDVDAVIVPVGSAGLLAGIAVAVKSMSPKTKIIGVESERAAAYQEALKLGKPVETVMHTTLADSIAVPFVGTNAFATARPLVDKVLTIDETHIALAILRLVEQEKLVVEGAGAASLAAVLSGQLEDLRGKRVAVVLSGGNIDTCSLGRVLDLGMAADGRLNRFVVTISDRPGGLAELTRFIANCGASVKDIFHERAFVKLDIYSAQVRVIVETRDKAHAEELEMLLNKNYKEVLRTN